MGNIKRIGAVILCLLCIACKQKPETGNIPLETSDFDLSKMNWIIGIWKSDSTNNFVSQKWQKQGDSVITAENIVIVDEDTIFNHGIKIYPVGNDVVLETKPAKWFEDEEKYMMIVNKNGEHVFENKMKDFPQRIIFIFNTDGSLYYRLEGSVEGKAQYQDFTLYKKG